jgi:hypothetical protein
MRSFDRVQDGQRLRGSAEMQESDRVIVAREAIGVRVRRAFPLLLPMNVLLMLEEKRDEIQRVERIALHLLSEPVGPVRSEAGGERLRGAEQNDERERAAHRCKIPR